MEEIAEHIFKPFIRLIVGILRVLLFLGWDLLFEYVGWSVGWAFYRLVSFGKFPSESWSELEQASLFTRLIVELTGIGLLGFLVFFLSQLIE
jgi:hypothetical protein